MDSTSTAPTRPGTSSSTGLRVVPCEREDSYLVAWLHVMAERYRVASGDRWPAGTGYARLRAHRAAGGKAMALWLLLDEGTVSGYAVTELRDGPDGRECFVLEGYAEPSSRLRGAPISAMIVFEAWARKHYCRVVKFATFRSDAAYARLLRRVGYRRAEVTFVKSLEAAADGQ